jgi:hypothetical protein
LVVFRPFEPQVELRPTREDDRGNQVATLDFPTVGSNGVGLVARVRTPTKTVGGPPTRVTAHDDHIPTPLCPLALHTDELAVEVEDQVIALVIQGARDTDPSLTASWLIAVSATRPF